MLKATRDKGQNLIHSLGFLASQVTFQCPGQLPGSTCLTQRLTLLTLSSPASRPLLPRGSSSSWLVLGTLGSFLLIFPSFEARVPSLHLPHSHPSQSVPF